MPWSNRLVGNGNLSNEIVMIVGYVLNHPVDWTLNTVWFVAFYFYCDPKSKSSDGSLQSEIFKRMGCYVDPKYEWNKWQGTQVERVCKMKSSDSISLLLSIQPLQLHRNKKFEELTWKEVWQAEALGTNGKQMKFLKRTFIYSLNWHCHC